jgi:hypothetical protein
MRYPPRDRLVIALLMLASTTGHARSQAIDTVRVGSPSVAGATLAEGTRLFESHRLAAGERSPISTTEVTISREPSSAGELYRIHSVHASADGDTTVGTILVRADDFALVHHRVKAAEDSAAVSSTGGHLTGWVVLPGQPTRLIDLALDHPVFPVDGPQPWLVGLLPLRDGYAAAIPRFSQWDGGEVWKEVRVLGSETVEVDGAPTECWTVDMGPLGPPGYRAMAWVDKATGGVVQGALRGEPGQPEYWAIARTN